jgi:hypothetical protein
MRLRTAIALVATAAGLLLAQAVPAAAAGLPFQLPSWAPAQLRAMVQERTQPPRHHRRNPFTVSFELKANHGYQVAVVGSEHRVLLEVGRKKARAITAYVVPGVVTRKRLVADFGKFGKLSMRFRPPRHGPGSDPHAVCRFHHHVLHRPGVFRGRLAFHGENEYFSLNLHRAKGEVTSVGSHCKKSDDSFAFLRASRANKPHDNGPEPRFFAASWRHDVDSAGFLALEILGIPLFLAASQESEGRLAIVRLAFAIGHKARAFTLDDAITHATLSPPAPFHGTGVYNAAPDGTKTWEGSLSVNFPGTPRFVLTGPPFEPEIEAGFEHSPGGGEFLGR